MSQASVRLVDRYKNRTMLETIFRLIDKDSSGSISRDEFVESVKAPHLQTPKHLAPANINIASFYALCPTVVAEAEAVVLPSRCGVGTCNPEQMWC